MSRQVPCPHCGGPIEFKLGSSWAMVCPYCRMSVMRTQTDLRAIGQVADLVPTAPDLTVGHRVYVGEHEFVVGGRLQLDHGRGPWDEYYVVETRTQRWGWLAKAQGRWILTFAVEVQGAVPSWQELVPGRQGPLLPGVPGIWTVAERGQSRLVSAEGELPFPVVPGAQGWYVDLSGPSQRFATIDYGDGSGPPAVYTGQELPPGSLRVGTPGMAPPVQQKVEATRLRCPRCGAPVPIQLPESTERAGCASCGALLDYDQGELRFLRELEQARLGPVIPLGREGTLRGMKVTCIAYLEREAWFGNENFVWREFLLYAEGHGYQWLILDNGHWTLMAPVPLGDVTFEGSAASYGGRRFVCVNSARASVCYVIGEVYWKVEVGEIADVIDFVHPPYIVSHEQTANEINVSAGQYLEPAEVWQAFQLEGEPPPQSGVGLCQPNPWNVGRALTLSGVFLALLIALFFVFELLPPHPTVVSALRLPMPPTGGSEPGPEHALRTPPFTIEDGPTVLDVHLETNVENQYVGVEGALVNTTTGEVRDFYVEAGYFRGNEGGESWSEGSREAHAYVDKVPAGTYVMDFRGMWQSYPQPGGPSRMVPPAVQVSVTVGRRNPWSFWGAFLLLLLPIGFTMYRHSVFEKKRRGEA